MKEKNIELISEKKVIVIMRGIEREKLIPLTEALYDGGIRLLEITYDATGAKCDEETSEEIKLLSEHFDGRMVIGAGTVLSEKQIRLTADAGGKFIISPDTNADIIARTNAFGLVSIPGAMTPSEITAAHRAGADFVKLFPVSLLGVDYIKAIRAPLSHVKMLAVGGVTPENISEYCKAGACGFGVGSAILDKRFIENDRFDEITKIAATYVKSVSEAE